MILFFLKIAVILGSSYNKTILPLKYSSNRCSLTSKKKKVIQLSMRIWTPYQVGQKQITKIKLQKWIIKRNGYYWFTSKNIYKKGTPAVKLN